MVGERGGQGAIVQLATVENVFVISCMYQNVYCTVVCKNETSIRSMCSMNAILVQGRRGVVVQREEEISWAIQASRPHVAQLKPLTAGQ